MAAWSNVQVIHIRACDLFNLLKLPPGLKVIQPGNFPRIFFLSQALRRKGVFNCVIYISLISTKFKWIQYVGT